MIDKKTLSRRAFLHYSAVAGASAALAACAPAAEAPSAPADSGAAAGEGAAASAPPDLPFEVADEALNPLGLEPGQPVEGVFFEGGFGRGYLDNAADIFRALHPENEMSVAGIQRVGDQLRPRFIGGNPPDVIDNSGAIRAALAILFDEESTAEQQIFNTGIIEGTAGTAIRFAPGQGASLLSLSGGSQIIGDVIFGDNSDTVAVEDLTSGVLINSMFDGNGGSDLADFADYELGDLTSVAYLDAATVLLGLQAGNGDSLTGTFSDFESFRFGGIDYAFEDLGDLVTRPIPLPAGLPLLATALAGTVLLRRRR